MEQIFGRCLAQLERELFPDFVVAQVASRQKDDHLPFQPIICSLLAPMTSIRLLIRMSVADVWTCPRRSYVLPSGGSLSIARLISAITSTNWEFLSEDQTETDNGRGDHLHCNLTTCGGWATVGRQAWETPYHPRHSSHDRLCQGLVRSIISNPMDAFVTISPLMGNIMKCHGQSVVSAWIKVAVALCYHPAPSSRLRGLGRLKSIVVSAP